MNVEKDFADLCSLLNANRVEYLVIGGYAVAFHGAPRFTGDLDLLIRPDSASAARTRSRAGVRFSVRKRRAGLPAGAT